MRDSDKKREKNQKCIKLWIVFLRHLNEGTLKHVPRFLQWTLVAPHCPLRYSSPCKPCGTLFKRNFSNGTIEEGFIQEKAKVVAASWGTEFIKFLSTHIHFEIGLFDEHADLHEDELKNQGGKSAYSSNRPDAK